MTLGELITALEQVDPKRVLRHGFDWAMSYRGFYDELAFEPKDGAIVGEMLRIARAAVGAGFEGYKGGWFQMDLDTPVWLAEYGECGEQIGPRLLAYMLNDYDEGDAEEKEVVRA